MEVLTNWLEPVASWVEGQELLLCAVAAALLLMLLAIRRWRATSARPQPGPQPGPPPVDASAPEPWPVIFVPSQPSRLPSDVFEISDELDYPRRPSTVTELSARLHWSESIVPRSPSWVRDPPPVPADARARETRTWDPPTQLETCWQRQQRRARVEDEVHDATTLRILVSPFDVPTGVYPHEFGLAIMEEKRRHLEEKRRHVHERATLPGVSVAVARKGSRPGRVR